MNQEEYYALAVDVEGKELSLKVDENGILKVPGNQKIQQLTTNAVKVFCRNNQLKLLEAPDAIYVGCNKNQLISLRVDNAEEVNCSENKLTELYAPKAKNVRCSFNKLTHLALDNAIEIDCSGNSELKELIAPKARKVDCYVTKIEFEDVKEIDFSLKNSFGRTTLENYDICELTIDLEHKDAFGRTALNTAASLGQICVAQTLVDKKADINTVDNNNLTPLLNALIYLEESMIKNWDSVGSNDGVNVKYEIINGCFRYINPYTGDDSLGRVLPAWEQEEICEELSWAPKEHLNYWETVDLIIYLIKNGANFEDEEDEGHSAILYACSIGEPALMQNLIAAGATFDVKDKSGITPLHYLARSKRVDGLEEYYKLNDNKFSNFKDEKGWTPLHFLADLGGHRRMAEILLENGADVNAESTKEFVVFPVGTKPAEVAKHWNDEELARLLS